MSNPRLDMVQIALILNVVAVVIAVVAGGVVVWANAASRNLALAVGIFGAAAFLLLIQLPFELQRSIVRDRINTSITIDRAKPAIRQWAYAAELPMAARRIAIETGASSWLALIRPQVFEQDREKLTTDFMVFSLVGFLNFTEFDWQLRSGAFKGATAGTTTMASPVSKPGECALIEISDLADQLARSGNTFADLKQPFDRRTLCLPPESRVEIEHRALTIRTPICQVRFSVNLAEEVSYMKPETGETPSLPGGDPQYETRSVGFDVETTYFALRAQNRHSEKYRDWCSRVVTDAQIWFES